MIKIGITGGIGSGKTTVCKYFEEIGIAVYYSDQEAKHLMQSNEIIIKKIISAFGEESYESNQLNREFIASKVFPNPEQLEKLNEIVHPVVINDFLNWSNNQAASYVILESALIFESKINCFLDKIICVTATDEQKIERISKRDQLSAIEIRRRIDSQMTDSDKEKLSDFVIISGDKNLMKERVFIIHEEICKLFNINNL